MSSLFYRYEKLTVLILKPSYQGNAPNQCKDYYQSISVLVPAYYPIDVRNNYSIMNPNLVFHEKNEKLFWQFLFKHYRKLLLNICLMFFPLAANLGHVNFIASNTTVWSFSVFLNLGLNQEIKYPNPPKFNLSWGNGFNLQGFPSTYTPFCKCAK